jgi:hypothetical protein
MTRQRRVYEQRLGGGEGAVSPVHMPPLKWGSLVTPTDAPGAPFCWDNDPTTILRAVMSIRRLEADQGKASEENRRFAFVVAGHDATLRPSLSSIPVTCAERVRAVLTVTGMRKCFGPYICPSSAHLNIHRVC